MLTAIDLYDQTGTEKIYDIGADRLLSVERDAKHLLPTQLGPELTLGIRHLLPQFSRNAFQGVVVGLPQSESPLSPLFQSGERLSSFAD